MAEKPVYKRKQMNAPPINATTVLFVKLLAVIPIAVKTAASKHNPI